MKKVIFIDERSKTDYKTWLNRVAAKLEKFSIEYNAFAKKIGIEPFSEEIFNELKQYGSTVIESKINSLADQQEIPAIRLQYLEHYYSQFNLIKDSIEDLKRSFADQSFFSGHVTFPSELYSIENLPRIENGKFIIDEDFIKNTDKFFEKTVDTDSREYALLNQFKETYEELHKIGIEKGILSGPMTWGPAEGLVFLTEITFFLKVQNDKSVTINDETLRRLTAIKELEKA